jgi:hypothetical protein
LPAGAAVNGQLPNGTIVDGVLAANSPADADMGRVER